jgi:hypothetical protein
MFLEFIQSSESLSISFSTIVAVISAIAALLATFIGPFTAFKVAKMQITRAAATAERKEWIDSFRNDVAKFTADAHSLSHQIHLKIFKDNFSALFLMMADVKALHGRIKMRLDINQASHKEVYDLLDVIIRLLWKCLDFSTSPDELLDPLNNLEDKARKLILAEVRMLHS